MVQRASDAPHTITAVPISAHAVQLLVFAPLLPNAGLLVQLGVFQLWDGSALFPTAPNTPQHSHEQFYSQTQAQNPAAAFGVLHPQSLFHR